MTANKKKMKASPSNPTIFSDDITIDLFSRLPVKSLMRFKCVSKNFNSLISESYFMDIHEQRSKDIGLAQVRFFVQELDGFYSIEGRKLSRCNFDFPYDKLSYHNGLFCFWVEKFESVRIFNPGTGQVIVLPRVKKLHYLRNLRGESYLLRGDCSYTLGYESEEKKY